MSDTQNVELLIKDIHERVAAMDAARMTEESVRALVQGVMFAHGKKRRTPWRKT